MHGADITTNSVVLGTGLVLSIGTAKAEVLAILAKMAEQKGGGGNWQSFPI